MPSPRPLRQRPLLLAALFAGVVATSVGCDSSRRVDDDAAAERTSADDEPTTPTRRGDLARFTAGIEGQGVLVATLHTSLGDIRCRLYEERAPATVANFVGLARGLKAWVDPETGQPVRGEPLYQNVPFHRVVPGFLIQTGDPSGDGRGGPGYAIEDEFHDELDHARAGTLSMANRSRPDTAGSQFFITERAASHLDGRHAVFGRCVDLDVIRSIARVPAGPDNRPKEPAMLESVSLSRGTFP